MFSSKLMDKCSRELVDSIFEIIFGWPLVRDEGFKGLVMVEEEEGGVEKQSNSRPCEVSNLSFMTSPSYLYI